MPKTPEYAPDDGLVKRLAAFSRWLTECADPYGFYIADPDGLPIHLENVGESQVVAGVALGRSLHPLRKLVSAERIEAITLHLGEGRILHTLWSPTRVGKVGLGFEPRRPLHPDQFGDVMRAVQGIFDPEGIAS